MIDLTGRVFGRLTVLYLLEERKNNSIMWHCKCSCGKEIDVASNSLSSGNTKSCGCLKSENANFAKLKNDLVGKVFGFLTVIEETPYREYGGKVIWKCKCKCGNIIYVNTNQLNSGNTTSCGCRTQSLGALNVESIIKKNNISYIKEYTNLDLVGKRFDFALKDKDNNIFRFIEYDGE